MTAFSPARPRGLCSPSSTMANFSRHSSFAQRFHESREVRRYRPTGCWPIAFRRVVSLSWHQNAARPRTIAGRQSLRSPWPKAQDFPARSANLDALFPCTHPVDASSPIRHCSLSITHHRGRARGGHRALTLLQCAGTAPARHFLAGSFRRGGALR